MFATARNEKSLDDLKAIGIELIHLEVTNPQQIQEARKYVEDRTGGTLDILVNNACVVSILRQEENPIENHLEDATIRSPLWTSTSTRCKKHSRRTCSP